MGRDRRGNDLIGGDGNGLFTQPGNSLKSGLSECESTKWNGLNGTGQYGTGESRNGTEGTGLERVFNETKFDLSPERKSSKPETLGDDPPSSYRT